MNREMAATAVQRLKRFHDIPAVGL